MTGKPVMRLSTRHWEMAEETVPCVLYDAMTIFPE